MPLHTLSQSLEFPPAAPMTNTIDFIQNVSQTRAPETQPRSMNAFPNHTGPSLAPDAPDDDSERYLIGEPFAVAESDLGSPTTPVHTLGVQGLQVAKPNDIRPPSSYLWLGPLQKYNDVLSEKELTCPEVEEDDSVNFGLRIN